MSVEYSGLKSRLTLIGLPAADTTDTGEAVNTGLSNAVLGAGQDGGTSSHCQHCSSAMIHTIVTQSLQPGNIS